MSEIAEYLSSQRAAEDVARRLAEPQTISRNIDGRCYVFMENGVWRQLELCARVGESNKWEVIRTYFRPEGARYIVTDLGEGQRALRLRTGRTDLAGLPERIPGVSMDDGGQFFAGAWDFVGQFSIPAADLPAAICRAMLASYRVANLPTQEGA